MFSFMPQIGLASAGIISLNILAIGVVLQRVAQLDIGNLGVL
jgi:hypothetical protein